MRRILYTLLLLVITSICAEARTPIRNWLVSMPDSVMPLLTKNNRLDFIDFYDAKMEAVVTNRLEGKSHMDMLTDDFVHFGYTKSSEVTMKLLPVNDSTDILCMVTTARAAVGDSRIAFFDDQWHPLDAVSYIHEPHIEDFRSTLQSDSAQWAWSKMDIFFRTYQLSAESTELKCVLTATEYLSKEDREEVVPYVRQEPLIYRWINNAFQLNE